MAEEPGIIETAQKAINQKYNEFVVWLEEPDERSVEKLKIDIIGNETLSGQSDVTDNYVESNVAYQNHISRKPLKYTLEGEIGEVTYYQNLEPSGVPTSGISGVLKDKLSQATVLPNKLTKLTTFAPSVSKKTFSIMDKATKVLNFFDSGLNFVQRWGKLLDRSEVTGKTMQSKAYIHLIGIWYSRTPLNIRTPWRTLYNFVITNIEFSQNKSTKDKTTVRITFKEFREIEFRLSKYDAQNFRGSREQVQKALEEVRGSTTGINVTQSSCKSKFPNQPCVFVQPLGELK